jgi:hypothetical protein
MKRCAQASIKDTWLRMDGGVQELYFSIIHGGWQGRGIDAA